MSEKTKTTLTKWLDSLGESLKPEHTLLGHSDDFSTEIPFPANEENIVLLIWNADHGAKDIEVQRYESKTNIINIYNTESEHYRGQ